MLALGAIIIYNIIMQKKFLALALIAVLLALFVPQYAAAATADEFFGSEVQINLQGEGAEAAEQEIMRRFEELENIFSLTRDSDLKRLNENGRLDNAPQELVELVLRAKELFELTSGAFDPASYLLADLWQLSSRFSSKEGNGVQKYDRELYSLPEQKYIDAFKKLTDFSKVKVQNGSIFLPRDEVEVDGVTYTMQIDLGGIAKGFAAQEAKEICDKHGVTQGYVSLGGSSILFLDNGGADFSVRITNPDDRASGFAQFNVKNKTVSTSGDYERYVTIGGKRYCHIIDCATGRPVDNGITSASVVCDDPVVADALTTAIMTMGFDNARAFINGSYFKENDMKAVMVFKKGWLFGSVNEVVTNAPRDFLQIVDQDFRLTGYNEGGAVYDPTNPNLWLFISVAGICVVVCIGVAIYKKRRSAPKSPDGKFFRPWDVAAYAVVAVLVVAAFLGFVTFNRGGELNFVEVYHGNDLVFVYDANAKTGMIANEENKDEITQKVVNGKLQVTFEFDGHVNVVEFDGKYAKMIEADCSATKECVNNFSAITESERVIICDVAHVRVIGRGEGEMPVIVG